MEEAQIKGLDWETGLNGVNKDENLFLDVLRTYCDEGREMLERYQNYPGDDVERTIIDMHGMKSASAGIGAMGLSAEFKAMELEGKTGNAAYLSEHMEECMLHLKNLTDEIQTYLDNHRTGEMTDVATLPEEVLAEEVLAGMIAALDDIEFELFEEKAAQLCGRNYGKVANEGIKKASDAYENFEYDDAKEILVNLKKRLYS